MRLMDQQTDGRGDSFTPINNFVFFLLYSPVATSLNDIS